MSDQDREEYEVQQEQWWEQQDKDEDFIMKQEKTIFVFRASEDGEYIWEMCGEYWCADCVDKDHDDPQDIPGFEGTHEALNDLTI